MKTIIIDGIEYNLTPKVLFKKGDFVVIQETTYLISKIEGINVTLFCNGRECLFDIDVLKNARLWDISKDAKAGDVLVSGDVIFILNKIHGVWVNCLCSLHKDGSFNNEDYDLMHIKYSKEVYPATKEQRDTLEKAMADSGWAFDFEKKELKKIEQKFTPKYKNGDCIEYRGGKYKITKVTVTPHNFFYDVSLIEVHSDSEEVVISIGMAAEEQMFKIEQKPAWSEEDEAHIMAIDLAVNRCLGKWHCCGEKCPISEHNPWLKSLKDRVQPQFTWKPSDEQMEVLLSEVTAWSKGCSKQKVLESLYQDLKKLK